MSKQIVLGVKLNESEASVFQHWCKTKGMSPNEVLTYVVQCVMKMLNGETIKNEKLRKVMELWDSFKDINLVANVIAPGAKVEVVETIYLLTEQGKRGTYPVLVEPSFFGEPKFSTSAEEILDEVMRAVCKGLLRSLRKLAPELDANGIVDTIQALLEYYRAHEDTIANEVAEMFADNDRHEYGKSVGEIIKYKRHNRSDMEQMKIDFGPSLSQCDISPERGEEDTNEDEL